MASDDVPQSESILSVGQQLKQAREQRGLSVSDVANVQHLRPAVIQAIENGEHERIDSELFLKGYVRTYAVQVGLEPDALIAQLDQELEPLRLERERALEANPLVDIERRRRRKRRIARVLAVVVLLVVIGVLTAYVLRPGGPVSSDSASDAPAADSAGSGTGDVSSGADTSADNSETPIPDSAEAPADSLPDPATDESSADAPVAEDGMVTGQVTDPAAATDGSASVEAPYNVREPVDEPTLLAGDAAEAAEPVAEAAQPAADSGQTPLVINFSADCWIQIIDADGQRLTASLQRAGDRLSVSGKAPMKVVIGAVDAVQAMEFDGRTVNLSQYPASNNRAEFTLTR